MKLGPSPGPYTLHCWPDGAPYYIEAADGFRICIFLPVTADKAAQQKRDAEAIVQWSKVYALRPKFVKEHEEETEETA